MKKTAYIAAAAVLFAACSGMQTAGEVDPYGDYYKNPSAMEKPAGLSFRYEALPDLSVPAEAGVMDDDDSLRDTLNLIFTEAYVETLLRGLPMSGVLGSDRIHKWPPASPAGWSQNFESADKTPNSWGIPGFVLAVAALEDPVAAYLVYGDLLNRYGISAGFNGENGAPGYGVPYESGRFQGGAAVQHFSRGTIRISRAGSAFIPAGRTLAQDIEKEFNLNDPVERLFANHAAAVFAERYAGSSARPWRKDGGIEHIGFSRPWLIEGTVPFQINGLYLLACNGGRDAFVLLEQDPAQAVKLPVRVRHISAPILNALIHSSVEIEGVKAERALGRGGGSVYARAVIGGFAVYGLPLSDMIPLNAEAADNTVENPARYRAAQRFSRGWISADLQPEFQPLLLPEEALPESAAPGTGIAGKEIAEIEVIGEIEATVEESVGPPPVQSPAVP
ncbi:MAG: hypothetical protein LBJ31_10010 [Treponema sp.]|jgi:hypothetical protein|nr:hypothetical protein [Treponema sp.]